MSKQINIKALRLNASDSSEAREALTAEAPLQIKVNMHAFTTTMRTPGDDAWLARGLLFAEGVIPDPATAVKFREERDEATGVILAIDARAPEAYVDKSRLGRRSVASTASCGICGTTLAEDIALRGDPLPPPPEDERLDPARIAVMFAAMREAQPTFNETGGCHGAAICSAQDELLATAEDVGRHNAVDKAVGALLEAGRLGEGRSLLVSGRISFEIVSKAWRAGLPFVLGVSAASSMAVEQAERFGLAVVGFCRDGRATVYSRREYIKL
jgi:FdhD protein